MTATAVRNDDWDLAELDALVAEDKERQQAHLESLIAASVQSAASARKGLYHSSNAPKAPADTVVIDSVYVRAPQTIQRAYGVAPPPTEKQIGYIRVLASQKGRDLGKLEQWLRGRDRLEVSAMIDRLAALPGAATTAATVATLQSAPQVPDGHYAVPRDEDGAMAFYKVNSPTEERWAGRTFVEVQASEEFWPLRSRAARDAVLAKIAADVQGAMLAYGREIGRCGHCNRTLTDPESIARGIGPVCAGKMGWA